MTLTSGFSLLITFTETAGCEKALTSKLNSLLLSSMASQKVHLKPKQPHRLCIKYNATFHSPTAHVFIFR